MEYKNFDSDLENFKNKLMEDGVIYICQTPSQLATKND